jgi:hypothetical protein
MKTVKFAVIVFVTLLVSSNFCRAQVGAGMLGPNLYWVLSDSTLTISGSGEMIDYGSDESGDNTTPAWFSQRQYVKNVIIEVQITKIGNYTFRDHPNLNSVELPSSITNIGNGAFQACEKLTSISDFSNIVVFGNYAFFRCSNLTLPPINFSSVTSIGEWAFFNCKGLNYPIHFSSNTEIGERAFYGTDVTEVYLPENITSISDGLLSGCTNVTSIKIPDGVTNIGRSAFALTGLTSITFPNGLTSIGDGAFSSTGLTSIIIPSGLTSIGNSVFAGTKITSITIPESFATISDGTFDGCSKLTSVTFPANLTAIGKRAFAECPNLKNITIPSGIILDNAFLRSGLITAKIGAGVTFIGNSSFNYSNDLTSFEVDNSNPNYSSENGVLFNKDKSILVFYPRGANDRYTIPSSVRTIAMWALSELKYVTIPDNVFGISTNGIILADTVETKNKIPVTVETGAFGFGPSSASNKYVLIVPDGTDNFYKNAAVWKDFGTIIEKSSVANEILNISVELKVFPNPASDYINVQCAESSIGKDLKVFGINGALLDTQKITESQTVIDVSSYPAGIYIVNVDGKAVKFVKK